MWIRKELKTRGKAAFKANYWKCVLVAFLMFILLYGGLGAGSRSASGKADLPQNVSGPEEILKRADTPGEVLEGMETVIEGYTSSLSSGMKAGVAAVIIFIILVAVAAGSLLKILVMNPLEVGCKGFFLHNSEAPASLDDIGAGFRDWGRVVKTMFLKDLFQALWGLLFIIPGIIKRYSYRMVPYLLADDPTLTGTEAITISRKMMSGHKWRAFVLDLSFLGWQILSALTAELLGIFYVNPYIQATDAELYRAILEETARE